jgi:hypothetical protein
MPPNSAEGMAAPQVDARPFWFDVWLIQLGEQSTLGVRPAPPHVRRAFFMHLKRVAYGALDDVSGARVQTSRYTVLRPAVILHHEVSDVRYPQWIVRVRSVRIVLPEYGV